MKLFLDDMRDPKDTYPHETDWTLVTTYEAAIKQLETRKVTELSLDHDLGTEKTGYDVVRWIEEKVALEGFKAPSMRIHSANPVGRKNIEMAITSIERLS